MNEAIKMQLSAFVDGELPENESELLLRRLSQDAELRQQVSEYLVIGRVMRGEPRIHGIDTLRDRISAALDDGDYPADADDAVPPSGRIARPIAGIAVAATVAVVALFGVRQITDTGVAPDDGAAPSVAITQPGPDELLDQYRQSHAEAERGAVAISERLRSVDVPVSDDGEFIEIPAAGNEADDASDAEESDPESAAVQTGSE